jgi:hypothetical protein
LNLESFDESFESFVYDTLQKHPLCCFAIALNYLTKLKASNLSSRKNTRVLIEFIKGNEKPHFPIQFV